VRASVDPARIAAPAPRRGAVRSGRRAWLAAALGPLLVALLTGAGTGPGDDLEWLGELEAAYRAGGSWRFQRDLEEYLAEFPDSEAAWRLSARVYADRGEMGEAREALERAGATETVLYGRVLLRLGEHERALALADEPGWPPGDEGPDGSPLAAALVRVRALEGLGRLAEARREARVVTDEVDDRTLGGYGLLDLGRLYVVQRRFELAGQAFVFADAELNGRQGPGYRLREPEVLVELGAVYATTRQSGGGADPTLTVLNEVLEVDDAHPGALAAKARAYLYAQKGRKADEALARALERDPTHPEALFLSGKMALLDRRVDDALALARRRLDVDPRDRGALALDAVARAVAGRPGAQAAREAFTRAHPQSGTLDALLGEVLQRHYRFEESVAPLERALELDAVDESPMPVLGQSLAHLGREDEARAILLEHEARSPFPYPWRTNMIRVLEALDAFAEVTDEGRFRVRLPPAEQDVLGPLMLETMDRARADMAARWGVEPKGEVLLEVFDVHEDFSVRTVGFGGFGALGACFGRVVTLVSPLSELRGSFHWQQTAVHEYAHVVTLALSRHRVPRWLTEGVSVVEEKRRHPAWARELERPILDARANGALLPVAGLDAAFRDASTVMLGYYQGSLVVETIERDFGFDALRALVAAYGEGLETPEAIEQVLGITPAELDERLHDYIDDVLVPRARIAPRYDEAGKERLRRRVLSGEQEALIELAAAYQDLGRETDRDAALDRYLEAFGETPAARRVLAERDASEGREEAARERLEAWWRAGEDLDADGLVMLAGLRLRAGDEEGAVDALRSARELYPVDVGPGGVLPMLHQALDRAGHEEEADALRAEIVAHDETARRLRLELGREARERGDVDEALRLLREAAAIDPYRAGVRMEIAELLEQRGDLEGARRQWRLVLGVRASQVESPDQLERHQQEARRRLQDEA